MNENQSLKEKLAKLDKTGKIILILSLSLSLIFFILGFSRCDAVESSGGENPPAVTLTLNSSKNFSTAYGEEYEIEFTPTTSGTYSFFIDDARLVQVKEKGANTTQSFYSTSYTYYDYDYGYRLISLASGQTYILKVQAEANSCSCVIERY